MKKSCKRCVALESGTCRLGYPIYFKPTYPHPGQPHHIPAPRVECPKPLTYDDYHHGKRYTKEVH